MAPHEDLIERLGVRFDAVVDGPLVIAMAAAGIWPMAVEDLGASPWVGQNTPAELREAWAASEPGTDEIDENQLSVMAMPRGTPDTYEPALIWRPLASLWRRPSMTEARCVAVAAAFVTAHAASVPFLTHAPEAWRAARIRFRKMHIIGSVECLHASVRLGRHDADAAWALYAQIARSAVGPQPGWAPLDGHTRQRFIAAMK